MDGTLGLLGGIHGGADGGGGGDGGGVPSCGSILTNSKEDDTMNDQDMLAEVSSSYPVDDDLELGLGLRIGGGSNAIQEGSRILRPNSCSSSSSSSSVNITNSSIAGFKRSAIDSVSPSNATSVVGWPPIRRAHRMPILANRIKSERKEYSSRAKSYLSVKVNMDGTLIGRKVDLNAHNSYETLARTLENMFYERLLNTETIGRSRLLSGTSEFVLTYEDKDGDCMLVGDVPWQMFVSSVKRLRILRSPKSRNCI